MSKVRTQIPERQGELDSPSEGDLRAYEVFVQLERGKPHMHCGSVDAVDDEMALHFAREHYGRDQQCVQVWVVRRDAIVRTDYEKDLVFRLSDQSYRFAKGYDVRSKWRKVRDARADAEYAKDDLREHY